MKQSRRETSGGRGNDREGREVVARRIGGQMEKPETGSKRWRLSNTDPVRRPHQLTHEYRVIALTRLISPAARGAQGVCHAWHESPSFRPESMKITLSQGRGRTATLADGFHRRLRPRERCEGGCGHRG